MKNKYYFPAIFILFAVLLPGCDFIGDVFKTGIWVGIIIVIAIIAVIAFVFKMFKN